MAYRYDVILEKYERVTLEEMREAHPLALGPFWGRPSRHGLPPVHFLPEVCAHAAQLGLAFVPLPIYSSWRNPIAKVWRWLKQTVIHPHPWAQDWPRLQAEEPRFLYSKRGFFALCRFTELILQRSILRP